ncbi:MAG: reverse transcriptase domain-containing protein, partial [Candidatus Thiodiazotropha sp.]
MDQVTAQAYEQDLIANILDLAERLKTKRYRNGQILHPVTGSPQGGVISPILANAYLHYALDLWFERAVKPRCHGQAILIRYADDYVCAFQYQR